MAVNEPIRISENPFVAFVSVHHGVLKEGKEIKKKKKAYWNSRFSVQVRFGYPANRDAQIL